MLDISLKSSVVLVLAWVVTSALRHRSPASLRHAVWALALMAALAMPAIARIVPSWHVPLIGPDVMRAAGLQPTADSRQSGADEAAVREAGLPEAVAPRPRLSVVTPSPGVRGSEASASWSPDSTLAEGTSPGRKPKIVPSWLLTAVWAAGFGLLLLRQAAGVFRSRRLAGTRTPGRAPWVPVARALARAIGAPRRTRFLRSDRVDTPMACGLIRPAVVLPAAADGWPEDRVTSVLLHELAHVRRRDCLTQAFADLTCAMYWFNPLAWVAVRALRRERERACDDMVLACGTPGPDYAEHLLDVARAVRPGAPPPMFSGGVAMAHRNELEGRLMAILDEGRPRRALSLRTLGSAAALALVVVVPIAAVNPWQVDEYTHVEASRPADEASPPVNAVAPAAVAAPVTPRRQLAAPARPVAQSTVARVAGGIDGGVADGIANGDLGVIARTLGLVANAALAQPAPTPTPTPAPTPTPTAKPTPTPKPAPDARPVVVGSKERPRPPADPKVVAALAEALKDTDADVRKQALHALAQLRDPSTFDAFVTALGDKDAETRQQAAHALAQLGDPRAAKALMAVLSDPEAEVRQQAVFALGQMRDPASFDALTTALKDADAEVRQQAAFGLGQLHDVRSVGPLTTALQDKDVEVRQQAAFALGQIRDPKAVDALIVAAKDADSEVRQQALFALSQIGDARAQDVAMAALKDADPEVRQAAAHALAQILGRR